jgi:hypothetical protein
MPITVATTPISAARGIGQPGPFPDAARLPATSENAVDDGVAEAAVVERAEVSVVVGAASGCDGWRMVVAVVVVAGPLLGGTGGGEAARPRAAATLVGRSLRTRL